MAAELAERWLWLALAGSLRATGGSIPGKPARRSAAPVFVAPIRRHESERDAGCARFVEASSHLSAGRAGRSAAAGAVGQRRTDIGPLPQKSSAKFGRMAGRIAAALPLPVAYRSLSHSQRQRAERARPLRISALGPHHWNDLWGRPWSHRWNRH